MNQPVKDVAHPDRTGGIDQGREPPSACCVTELWRYPVKSMRGEQLAVAAIAPDGIQGDRLVHVQNAHGLITARTHPSFGIAAEPPAAVFTTATMIAVLNSVVGGAVVALASGVAVDATLDEFRSRHRSEPITRRKRG